jgi:hypothetical protein
MFQKLEVEEMNSGYLYMPIILKTVQNLHYFLYIHKLNIQICYVTI